MSTTLIKHGKIIDGTGKAAFNGSVLIEDRGIVDIFPEGRELPEADRRIDAKGLVVSPGFIDMHSHSDLVLPVENHPPVLKCMVEQGSNHGGGRELRNITGAHDQKNRRKNRDSGFHSHARDG